MSSLVFRLLHRPLPWLAGSKKRSARATDRPKPTKRRRAIPQLEPLEHRFTPATVTFSTSDPGVRAAIPYWGLDTSWPSSDNMRRGLIFMGNENVNVVRMPVTLDAPLVDGDLPAAQKARLQQSIN